MTKNTAAALLLAISLIVSGPAPQVLGQANQATTTQESTS